MRRCIMCSKRRLFYFVDRNDICKLCAPRFYARIDKIAKEIEKHYLFASYGALASDDSANDITRLKKCEKILDLLLEAKSYENRGYRGFATKISLDEGISDIRSIREAILRKQRVARDIKNKTASERESQWSRDEKTPTVPATTKAIEPKRESSERVIYPKAINLKAGPYFDIWRKRYRRVVRALESEAGEIVIKFKKQEFLALGRRKHHTFTLEISRSELLSSVKNNSPEACLAFLLLHGEESKILIENHHYVFRFDTSYELTIRRKSETYVNRNFETVGE